jgi:hypothetical protein
MTDGGVQKADSLASDLWLLPLFSSIFILILESGEID